MNMQAALETLRRSPRDETTLRFIALELGGAVSSLRDEELVQLSLECARIQAADKDAPSWIQGFRSALASLLAGARQQRQQARERRAMKREADTLSELPLRQDWRRLLPAMLKGFIQQKKLAEELRMNPAQVSRNVNAMQEAGLLEEVTVEESTVAAVAHDKRMHRYRLTARGRQMAEQLVASQAEAKTTPMKESRLDLELRGHVDRLLSDDENTGWTRHSSTTPITGPGSILGYMRPHTRAAAFCFSPEQSTVYHAPGIFGVGGGMVVLGEALVAYRAAQQTRIPVQQDPGGASATYQHPEAPRNIFIGYRSKSAPVRIVPVVPEEEGER